MRRIKRIAVTACAASLFFGTLGTLNIPVGSACTSVLLARDDRESYNRGYEQGRRDARDGRGRESSRRWDSDFRKGYEDGYSQGLRGHHSRGDRDRPNDSDHDSRNDRYGRDGYGRDGYGARPASLACLARLSCMVGSCCPRRTVQ